MVALATLMTMNVWASHIMGGMVTVAQTNQDSTSVAVYLATDVQGVTPNQISVERWEMDSQGWYTLNGYVTLVKSATLPHQGTNLHTYISDYLDLDSNKYRFIYKNCCWGMLNNSTSSFSSDFVISADYWHIPNNSLPYMEMPFWINMQKDSVNVMKPVWGIFNCFFSQLDTDSVAISQSVLYSSYANGVFVPQTGQSPSNMWVNNDSITFVSSTLGPVGNGFEINEYRNGQVIGTQRIQWTFKVVNSTLGLLEIRRPNWNEVWDWQGNRVYQGETIPWRQMNGLYIIINRNGVEKIYVQ